MPVIVGVWMAVAGVPAVLAGLSGMRRVRRLRRRREAGVAPVPVAAETPGVLLGPHAGELRLS